MTPDEELLIAAAEQDVRDLMRRVGDRWEQARRVKQLISALRSADKREWELRDALESIAKPPLDCRCEACFDGLTIIARRALEGGK